MWKANERYLWPLGIQNHGGRKKTHPASDGRRQRWRLHHRWFPSGTRATAPRPWQVKLKRPISRRGANFGRKEISMDKVVKSTKSMENDRDSTFQTTGCWWFGVVATANRDSVHPRAYMVYPPFLGQTSRSTESLSSLGSNWEIPGVVGCPVYLQRSMAWWICEPELGRMAQVVTFGVKEHGLGTTGCRGMHLFARTTLAIQVLSHLRRPSGECCKCLCLAQIWREMLNLVLKALNEYTYA